MPASGERGRTGARIRARSYPLPNDNSSGAHKAMRQEQVGALPRSRFRRNDGREAGKDHERKTGRSPFGGAKNLSPCPRGRNRSSPTRVEPETLAYLRRGDWPVAFVRSRAGIDTSPVPERAARSNHAEGPAGGTTHVPGMETTGVLEGRRMRRPYERREQMPQGRIPLRVGEKNLSPVPHGRGRFSPTRLETETLPRVSFCPLPP